jgi:hypothetical protein
LLMLLVLVRSLQEDAAGIVIEAKVVRLRFRCIRCSRVFALYSLFAAFSLCLLQFPRRPARRSMRLCTRPCSATTSKRASACWTSTRLHLLGCTRWLSRCHHLSCCPLVLQRPFLSSCAPAACVSSPLASPFLYSSLVWTVDLRWHLVPVLIPTQDTLDINAADPDRSGYRMTALG